MLFRFLRAMFQVNLKVWTAKEKSQEYFISRFPELRDEHLEETTKCPDYVGCLEFWESVHI